MASRWGIPKKVIEQEIRAKKMMEILRSRLTRGTAKDVNFYFEGDRLAVSDNHRMAYWFFRNNAAKGSTLIHVDTHPGAVTSVTTPSPICAM